MIKIEIKKISHGKDLELPSYATEGSAGLDLMAAIAEPVSLAPFERKLIATGIAIALPQNYEAQIRPRSGLALKHGITCLNTPGTIDSDYRGEINVLLINLSDKEFVIEPKTRIAQMIISQYQHVTLEHVDELDSTMRGSGGFGSTGSN